MANTALAVAIIGCFALMNAAQGQSYDDLNPYVRLASGDSPPSRSSIKVSLARDQNTFADSVKKANTCIGVLNNLLSVPFEYPRSKTFKFIQAYGQKKGHVAELIEKFGGVVKDVGIQAHSKKKQFDEAHTRLQKVAARLRKPFVMMKLVPRVADFVRALKDTLNEAEELSKQVWKIAGQLSIFVCGFQAFVDNVWNIISPMVEIVDNGRWHLAESSSTSQTT